MIITKRDNTKQAFNLNKIYEAVFMAASDADLDYTEASQVANDTTQLVIHRLQEEGKEEASVYEIETLIENTLMSSCWKDVARNFIEYRHDRQQARDLESDLHKNIVGLVDQTNPDILHENANKESTVFHVQRDLLAGEISRHYALNYLLPRDVAREHLAGNIHFHDLDYFPMMGMTNCFSGDTKFISDKGTRAFKEFNAGDTLTVPTHTGEWKKAIVNTYGLQSLNKVKLKRGRLEKEVLVTGNHTWLLKDGSKTTSLKVGDVLIQTPVIFNDTWDTFSVKEKRAWALGFGYADGSMRDNGHGKEYFTVLLCGKKGIYAERFEEAGFYVSDTKAGKVAHFKNLSKQLYLFDSREEQSAFMVGITDADGSKRFQNKAGRDILSSIQWTGEEENKFLDTWLESAGFYLGATRDITKVETNYGARGGLTIERKVNPSQLHMNWKVVSIEPSVSTEEVWCLEVEDNHSFILSNGVVTGNCCLVDLEGMLKNGFKMGNAQIESPNSIQTAATVVSQIAAAVASSQYGGTSFDRLDEVLAPYVTKTYEKEYKRAMALFRRFTGTDVVTGDLALQCIESEARIATEKAVFDACQTLEYQVNTIYSTNGQTPFLTFGFGLGTSWEAKLVQKGILQNRIAGLGKEAATPVFPKLVFGLREGVNLKPEDPNYDIKQLALECASTRMYPDILNYDKTVEITGGYKAPMGCRSFLSPWFDENGKETYAGRNNLGVVSLNIPKIALEAQLDYDKFWTLLDEYCEIAHKGLQYRLERLATVKAKSAPIMYMEGALGLHLDGEEFVLPHLLKRGASISLGYIGLEEAANAMLGSFIHTYDEPEKQQFALDIVKFLDKKATEWKEAEGVGYSIYATPSESLCNRFCKAIVREYGEFEGVTDKGYLTNSFHLDVMKKVNPYDKIDFEAKFIPYSAGGHICYGEFPNMRHNLEALEDVWNYAYTKVPYYGTNTPIDECYECGFKGEFNCTSKGFECPNCGNHEPDKCSVTRRVCGYLGNPGTRPFNAGKQSEMTKRVKHL
ncbi:hypothetical protein AEO54_121 [Vibrio phage vB_VorS-PVo5]|nr:hypothetical protein AEO54_121 [Vibrio phage vB_VorS-PVo5]